MRKQPEHPVWVYQLEEVKTVHDLRNHRWVTVGMFFTPDKMRERVFTLSKDKRVKKHSEWKKQQTDNEYAIVASGVLYRYTRHCVK